VVVEHRVGQQRTATQQGQAHLQCSSSSSSSSNNDTT
jgi:hypothetical protein